MSVLGNRHGFAPCVVDGFDRRGIWVNRVLTANLTFPKTSDHNNRQSIYTGLTPRPPGSVPNRATQSPDPRPNSSPSSRCSSSSSPITIRLSSPLPRTFPHSRVTYVPTSSYTIPGVPPALFCQLSSLEHSPLILLT
ncbi:hypothetical protein ACRALDRAFT_1061829 [Sodiomyces alcalophilus JCM 7366]|uniref:uncharacterized protein n=1 Tax=Sodiomyces alcalophilus JCM 7366 TaxID=591952 RepID=UPI0039B57370